MILRGSAVTALVMMLAACGSDAGGADPDAAPADATSADDGAGGDIDAGTSASDASNSDAEPVNADAGPADAEPADATPPDAVPSFTLTVSATASGTVTSDIGGITCDDAGATVCAADYDQGTVVTLTASPAVDYAFDGWTGDCSGTNPVVTVTMDGSRTCSANFFGTTGDLEIIPAPVSVVPNVTQSNTDILVFQEQADVVLAADVPIDAHVPSTYSSAWLSPGAVASGTRVNVYYLHFDPASGTVNKTGAITFSNPIIGVASQLATLEATDGTLGASGVTYPAAGTHPDRDIEVESNDAYTISADRRTLSVDFVTSTSADQIRIITTAPGQAMPPLRFNVSDISPPASVEDNASEDNAVQVFAEQAVTLGADLAVDATNRRLYTAGTHLNGGTLTAGTTVASYLIHFDPPGTALATVEASLYFDGDILGVQVLNTNLDAGDAVVGAAGTTYGTGGGIEIGDDPFRIGDDGRGLAWRARASTGIDQIRVFVAD